MAKKKIDFDLASEVFEDASLSDTFISKKENTKNLVKISNLISNPNQPRLEIDQVGVEELANSILENGLLQPITVLENSDNTYTIVFGHRRVAAYLLLNKEFIEANILTELNDTSMVISPLVENLQRKDMNPLELAIALDRVLKMGIIRTQIDLAKMLGITQGRISKILSILKLDNDLLNKIYLSSYKDVTVLSALNKIPSIKQLEIFNKLINLSRDEALLLIKSYSLKKDSIPKKVVFSKNNIKININNISSDVKNEVLTHVKEIEKLLEN